MAQPQTWFDFITDDLGRSYFYENGVVGRQSVPRWLKVGPDGWADKTIKYARDSNYFELFRTYTNPFKYVKDGAIIVRDQLYRFGPERKLYHVIQRLDKSFGGGWQHKFFYRGELDLKKAQDADDSVTVNIMEGGLSKYLKAFETTEYELDIDVPEAVTVKMDGAGMKFGFKYLTIANGYDAGIGSVLDRQWLIPFANIGVEGDTLNIVTQDVFEELDSSIDYSTDARWFISAVEAANINANFIFTGTIKKLFPRLGSVRFRLRLIDQTGAEVRVLLDETRSDFLGFTEAININDSFVLNMNAEDRLFLVANIDISSTEEDYPVELFLNESTSSFNYISKHRTTFIKALRPTYVIQKLLDKMTGGGYTYISNYITSEWDNLLITSGDGLRGLTGAKLKTTWRDFFDSYNIPCNLSGGIRNQALIIERKANAFQPTVQLSLGEAAEMTVNQAEDYQYNRVKIGYPDTDTEDVNGREEFNVSMTYTSVVTRDRVLDLVSKYKASMYEIETMRRNLDGKTTTDDSNDNTVFFLHVEPIPTVGGAGEPATYYKLLRNVYDSVTGLIDPATAYNLELHPELCLARHGNWLHGVFYWQNGTNLVRQSSDKNDRVVVIKNGQTYIGRANIPVVSLDPALFIPITFKVETPMPDDTIDVMDAGPNGTFGFTYNGIPYYGFPLELGIQPVERPAQETTLLCSPVTNILNLITVSR